VSIFLGLVYIAMAGFLVGRPEAQRPPSPS
jgi:hypothetical protein